MEPNGQLEQRGNEWQLTFTRTLAHPPEKVWRALTEPEQLTAWFPTEIIGDRADGATLRFEFRNGEGAGFDGKMITVDPPRVLEFVWGEDTLRFELQPSATGTVLTLTDSLGTLGKAARDAAGWDICLDRLAFDLSGDTAPRANERPWKEVNAVYVDRFGPEASTLGPPEGHAEGS